MAALQVPTIENGGSVTEVAADRRETNVPGPSPSLHRTNTRMWLTELLQGLGRTAALDNISDSELDYLAKIGFEWFLSVWQTGASGQNKVKTTNLET